MPRLSLFVLFSSCAFPITVFVDDQAHAGSISEDSSSGALCDQRLGIETLATEESFKNWCTPAMKKSIANSCYVVVSQPRIVGNACSWQGCTNLVLVGQPATLSGNNFVEYGVGTPTRGAPYKTVNGGVLPQHPYGRHYLTAGAARQALQACPGNPLGLPEEVRSKICVVDTTLNDFFEINPYLRCLLAP